MTSDLATWIDLTHDDLARRRDRLATSVATRQDRWDVIHAADGLLSRICRHTAATCEVVLPVAREHLPDGPARVKAYLRSCRALERSVAQMKAKLYGEAGRAALSWRTVWRDLTRDLAHLTRLERDLIDDLIAALPADSALADRIRAVESSGPTRPHPNMPHMGPFSRLARRVLARTDRLWDHVEGRAVHDPGSPEASAS